MREMKLPDFEVPCMMLCNSWNFFKELLVSVIPKT
jgi:hypothetical protein